MGICNSLMVRSFVFVVIVNLLVCGVGGNMLVSAQTPNIVETDSIADHALGEVVVTGRAVRDRMSAVQVGVERLELSRLADAPSMFGETDIVKSISLLPGVHAEGEGAGGFEVRGGTASQNLVMLNGATLYNPTHVLGIFSSFNDDAIGRATLFKGPFPASYGDATSAILETSLVPGDMEAYHGSATVGILAAKIKAEGPVVRDRLSFAVTARRSYVDMFLKMIPKYRDTEMNFYDVTASLRWIPRSGEMVDVSFIGGRDNMGITDLMDMRWGNLGGSVSWHVNRSDRWRFSTVAAATNYTTTMGMDLMRMNQSLREFIRDFSLSEKISCALSDMHSIEMGARSEFFKVQSGEFEFNGSRKRDIRSLWENAIWMGYKGVFRRINVEGGVRAVVATSLAGRAFNTFDDLIEPTPDFSGKTYFNLEPRLSVKYDFSVNHGIKAGVGVATQNIHSVRSSATSFPFDRYALVSAQVSPARVTQYGVSYTGMSREGMLDWSAEVYYKDMDHIYDYMDGCTMFSKLNLESIILGGKGRSYGLELMMRKNTGRLTGWIAYTLSRTLSRIPGINGGRWYDAANDRRHVASVVGMFAIDRCWQLSASWTYSSGNPITAPDLKYELDGATCYYYSGRNGYRTPASHRLDLSAKYTHIGSKFTYMWAFGIYNAYCHYSPYIIYFEDDPSKPSGTRAVQRSLYGLIPSVSYTLKF